MAVFADVIRDLAIGRISRIIWRGPQCDHKYSYGKETKGDLKHTHRGGDYISTEADIGGMWPQATEHQ